jgi:PAS domain S-box-containing protein
MRRYPTAPASPPIRGERDQTDVDELLHSKIAIVGGGKFCTAFLEILLGGDLDPRRPEILGVADVNDRAEGVRAAKAKGIYVTTRYADLFKLEGLTLLLELTNDPSLGEILKRTRPPRIKVVDHFKARSLWDSLQVEVEKIRISERLASLPNDMPAIRPLLETYARRLSAILDARNRRSHEIEMELVEHERVLSQIIAGSTIPTFVISQDHVVTHWNRALEKLTGHAAAGIVGTRRQWVPFYGQERPTMADVILGRIGDDDIQKLYGSQWRKSALIEGAYEAEGFFPRLGDDGKWCWFTAAPIKGPDGQIVGAIETLWDKTEERKAEVEKEAHHRELREKTEKLVASERILAQIVQGSTIPTFVIDKDHVVTHWNRALEKLTGHTAAGIVGTRRQWAPFYGQERPTMADVILDQIDDSEIQTLYGSQWRKSALIAGAYEAEGFFPRLGDDGKWCWFTAAPIEGPDGQIVGAIETLWDKTEDKKAEEERERHTGELSTLCSIYTALSTSTDLDAGIQLAIEEVKDFLAADGVCIYLLENDGNYHSRYVYGFSEEACRKVAVLDTSSTIHQVARSNRFTLFDELPEGSSDEIRFLESQQLVSLAYIPISTKKKEAFGVVRIGSRQPRQFSPDQKNVLELIGNRIGVAIENAILQEQYIASEEKYRSLFNNDPNPIFILDRKSFHILDINRRARDYYGYTRAELSSMSFLDLGDDDAEVVEGLRALSIDQSVFFPKRRHFKKGRIPIYVNINVSYATYLENDVLIAATTDVTESVEREIQLIQASKMTTLGLMAAGMAHEINQPLNVIQICADYFAKLVARGETIGLDEIKSISDDITDNVQRAAEIIRHMRDFSRQSQVSRVRLDLNEPIRDVFKILDNTLKKNRVEVCLDLDPELPRIMADHNRLEQVFINLVTNAVDAMDEKGCHPDGNGSGKRLTVRSRIDNERVAVTVSDTGVGMPPEVIDKIFEPFFTTKEVGRGTGLGVSISYGIIKDYDGTIEVESEVGKGTRFELTFPRATP